MKPILAAFSALLLFPLCATAQADSASIQAFLTAAQGHYSGSGESRHFSASGEKDASFNIDLQATLDDSGALTMVAQIDTDGNPSSTRTILKLTGGTLYYGNGIGTPTPMRVLNSSDSLLDYSYEAIGNDGLIYTVEERYALGTSSLNGHETVSVNGALVQSNDFQVTLF